MQKMVQGRAAKTKECPTPCLFYTQYLSGAAEREANFVLKEVLYTNAAEGPRKYQTIWVCPPGNYNYSEITDPL
jgi:hypothetical protein